MVTVRFSVVNATGVMFEAASDMVVGASDAVTATADEVLEV
jgi:hypothetical protein